MAFLRNAWYAAAWANEVSRTPMARTILARPVVLYRKEDGTAVALADRCPHRSAPLHKGKLIGDNIQCPYHGLQFDASGGCVYNPSSSALPKAATLHRYPIVERHKAVWIWTGDPSLADASRITDLGHIDDTTSWRTVKDVLYTRANYQLIADNLLDLSHLEFRHPSMAVPGVNRRMKRSIKQDGLVVWAFNESKDEPMTEMFLEHWPAGKETGRGTQWADMRWHAPGVLILDTGVTGVGRPREEGARAPSVHLLTPETEATCHYFWASSRNWGLELANVDEEIRSSTQALFRDEDLSIIEAQQLYLEMERDPMPVLLAPDEAAVRARRILESLIAQEARML
jgi:phenylpropionate dioxygenase-like ring-hydroxylating dioxygenase large terminal subunit